MMKKALVLALVAAVCVACRPPAGESPNRAAGMSGAGITHPAAAAMGVAPNSELPTGRASFASLSDRGDLVAYSALTPPRVDGAYTWHRTQISEAHAFQSIRTGSMRITSPSGRPLDFEYVRHVEHPSGDWTWVGRLKGGASSDEAVVTFGERAVFGSVADPGKPAMRLTTMRGSAWLVETDATKVAAIHNEATRPTSPDYFLPPQQVAALGIESSGSTSAPLPPSTAGAVSAAAAVTVDVVVGYTSGFAASLGGQSQAVTRLNNMVEIANQAYVNSQVDAAIRMVHSLQVDYPDNTANGTTLESLTGYRSGSGQIPVDHAFAALRAARDQYGGDLVTLVRKFQTPENDGCGIAWLIGGGRTGLDTGDAPFGYSVVSDGVDAGTDGKSYFCRAETLAHELGHNMGSQHDRATATENGALSYGVFTYSFGYKTAATNGNFYTVMAYGDTGQVPYRVFSNPRSTFCGGVPCGVVEEADNARSLSQTMPVVASFRAERVVVPTVPRSVRTSDLNFDGFADLIWRDVQQSRLAYWNMRGTSIVGSGSIDVGPTWRVAHVGDLNGDGRADVVWQGSDAAAVTFSLPGNTFNSDVLSYLLPSGWAIGGGADFDGDGYSDIFLRNSARTQAWVWYMRGNRVEHTYLFNTGSSWDFAYAGDANGDGMADIVWLNATQVAVSTSLGRTFDTDIVPAARPAGWRVVGGGDVDGDRKSDLVWRDSADSRVLIWYMDKQRIRFTSTSEFSSSWALGHIGDFNGDERVDLLWLGASQVAISTSLGTTFSSDLLAQQRPQGWNLVGLK